MALKGIANQFLETFKKLSLLQRVSLLAATVATFATVVVLILWANKPAYKTLYNDLSEQDIKEVTQALGSKNEPYKVSGNSVEITGDVYQTRIDLALQGLPKNNGVGFELFDDAKLGMTEFMQNVNYQRALEGEIARSIMALNEVVQAKVHLSIPKDRIFVSEDDEAKASVVMRLMPGAAVKPDQVRAITHLVASAVRGLSPNSVQVLDTNGNLLSDFLTDESNNTAYVTQSQLEHQRQIEKDLEKKLQGLLSVTLGSGNYVARVAVEMDFNKKEITREEYGDTPVLRSQHSLEINARNDGKGPQGIPGVESNLAEPDLLINGIMSEYNKSEETQNFEISKTVTHEQKNSGILKRITVSVVVDDKSVVSDDNGTRVVNKVARTDDDIAKIRAAVFSAVGADNARGDVIEVTNISFDTTADYIEYESQEKAKYMEWISIAAKYGSAVLIILLFFLLLVRPILKKLENAKTIDEEALGESALDAQISTLDITVGGEESGFPKTIEELEREIESELNESIPVDVEAVKSKVMLKKIEEASGDDPESIANLIRALLKGG